MKIKEHWTKYSIQVAGKRYTVICPYNLEGIRYENDRYCYWYLNNLEDKFLDKYTVRVDFI